MKKARYTTLWSILLQKVAPFRILQDWRYNTFSCSSVACNYIHACTYYARLQVSCMLWVALIGNSQERGRGWTAALVHRVMLTHIVLHILVGLPMNWWRTAMLYIFKMTALGELFAPFFRYISTSNILFKETHAHLESSRCKVVKWQPERTYFTNCQYHQQPCRGRRHNDMHIIHKLDWIHTITLLCSVAVIGACLPVHK